jgi:predicted outer membrane repeat protein
VFLNNTSNTAGGAVTAGNYDTTSLVNITACTFSNNQVSGTGGALYLIGAAYIQNSIIRNNIAEGSGGAIDAANATLTISGTVFSSNIAYDSGGAFYITNQLAASNTSFTANRAQIGGAVIHFSSAKFNNCNFTENLSLEYAGAISSQPGSSLVIANSLLSNNTAKYAGGAIFIDAPNNKFVIADTVHFSSNTAACCYANNGGISSSTSCINVDGNRVGANECCLAKYYSDGEHCQLCTKELTCAGIIGANTSTVVLPSGVWRASTTSLKTYSCWNSNACLGGVAAKSTDDYCATGYKGPCKLLYCYDYRYYHCKFVL